MSRQIKLFEAQNEEDTKIANEWLEDLQCYDGDLEIVYIPPGPEVNLNYPYIELPNGRHHFGLFSIRDYVEEELSKIMDK